jgi:hypothetical protein
LLHNHQPSGAGITGQTVAVDSVSPHEKKIKIPLGIILNLCDSGLFRLSGIISMSVRSYWMKIKRVCLLGKSYNIPIQKFCDKFENFILNYLD